MQEETKERWLTHGATYEIVGSQFGEEPEDVP